MTGMTINLHPCQISHSIRRMKGSHRPFGKNRSGMMRTRVRTRASSGMRGWSSRREKAIKSGSARALARLGNRKRLSPISTANTRAQPSPPIAKVGFGSATKPSRKCGFLDQKFDQWDVFAVPLEKGTPAEPARRLSSPFGADINHAVAADQEGGLWFVWQSADNRKFNIFACRITKAGNDEMQVEEGFSLGAKGRNLSASFRGGSWHPSVAVDGQNNVYVAWDAYENGSFNVYLEIHRGNEVGKTWKVAESPAFEGRVKVASAGREGVYLAWEEGGENWGKPFRGVLTPLISDHKGPLHRYRHLRIAKVSAEGKMSSFAEPFPMPSVEAAANRDGVKPDAKRLGAFYERPELCVDSQERLWVYHRHYYTPWLGIAHRSHIEEGFGVYARHLAKDGWSKLYRMNVGQGDGMQRLALTAHETGVAAIWTTGRTHRTANKRPRGLVTAWLKSGGEPGPVQTVKPVEVPVRKPPEHGPGRSRPKVKVGDQEYELFFGDLHRHTDLSLCRVPVDGTMDDAYRYAMEVAQLDFLGITDHTRDIAMGDHLSQLWWRCRKEVYRHQLGHSNSMTFVPFYSYERSHSETADHNVISLRPDMLRPYTYPVPEFWKELDLDTITIPHQPIRRETWNYQNDELRPLVEIFQGARDQSIENDVHRGLAKGYHLGFIASSDHMSTSSSYACVWAKDATRESLFQALKARRTFGATAKIRLEVRAGAHWMGEIVKAQQMPDISLRAEGTAPIASVKLVLDGKVIETQSPNQQKIEIQKTLNLKGSHYLYFQLTQSDGNEAWSSPIWFEIKK